MKVPLVIPCVALLAGCQLGYYAHLARGQYDLLSRREPITSVVGRQDVDPILKQRLVLALEARAFAERELSLPAGDSYTQYADLERPYAVWNVYAAPELSLEPRTWCHPFTGCVAYRGYYDEERAREQAKRLAEDGLDVYVGGVPAYSTLGWFDDPVLNTMLHWPDDVLAGVLLHELAHQRVFAKGDTAFNESYATFVERRGLEVFLAGRPELARAARARERRDERFLALVLGTRARLAALYASELDDEAKRGAKRTELAGLREAVARLRSEGTQGAADRDPFSGELNNAHLLPFGLYHEWVPAFEALFRDSGRDWAAFHRHVEALAGQDREARERRLAALRDAL